MKILAIGDAHLWPVIRPKLPQMRGDAFAAFTEAVQAAAKVGADRIVQVGDMFDYGEKGGVSSCLDFLAQTLTAPIYAIEGNHDLSGYSGSERNPPWVAALKGQVIRLGNTLVDDFGGLSVVGIDYCRGRDEFLEVLAALKEKHPGGVDVLVLHQGHSKLLGFDGCWEVCDEDVSGWANLVLIGHVHKAISWKDEGGTTWVSPGSLYRWRSTEQDLKRVAIIDFTEDDIKVDWVPLTQQRDMWYEVVETEEGRQALLDRLRNYASPAHLEETLRKPYLSLRYVPEAEFVRQLAELTHDRVYLEATPLRLGSVVRVATDAEEATAEESHEDQVARVTRKHVDPEQDPALYQLAVQIQLDVAADPSALIDEAVEAVLQGKA